MRHVTIALAEPPEVAWAGVAVHGVDGPHDVFRLPDLWQLHLYDYAAELVVEGTPHAIAPGHVSLIPPGAEAHFHYRGRSEHLYAHFRLPGGGDPRTVPVMRDAGDQAPGLGVALRQAVAAVPGTPARASAEVWSVLWRVASLPVAGSPHAVVAAAMERIEADLAAPFTVPAIARAAGVSHNHLTRLFRAHTGDTVVGYIRRRRMSRALHLLRESTQAIPAIAAAVGIPDLQAFNKACHRELGASPRALRARQSP
ncbi:helix-turn-helix domain-containing protein [Nonomuraea sp. MG754425]|uniref:helix-turn-helix transcriptional regulator n=1 Tax=Nonomuraea sp. MG754425 TaxID=2570319 RepID=UPI001F4860BB|nr:AraC family transcriptional regulator [Nonomuraea sp. MG754425]MCF6475969.1 helix-turn-helix domain-containing protein [Nonomuraea sp. MG754425]